MAYKFQLGAYTASGSLTQEGAIECDTSLTIGSAALTEAELEKLDGITNGTVAASKAVVVDANKDISAFNSLTAVALTASATITATGAITAGTSFIIGSADLNEADLEKLDGITNGTAAASKAVVLDASKNIATIGTIGCGAITSTGNSSFGQGSFSAGCIPSGVAALGSAAAEWADLYLSDGGIVYMGNDQEVQLIHTADSGIVLQNTADGAASAAMLKLQLSSSSPADDDEIGKLVFSGYNDNEETFVGGQILGKVTAVADGSEDMSMALSTIVNGMPVSFIDIHGTTAATVTFVDGAYDVDIASHDGTNGLKLGGTLVSADAAELNKLDGYTGTTAELNYLDLTTLGSSEASKVVSADASGDITIVGAAANMVWDKSADALEFADNASIEIGTGLDMKLYHDGTNSYITNAQGAMKIATETSGIAVSIGHATSETTVNDNLTVTGDLTVNGTTFSVNSTTIAITSSFTFEGATPDAYETVLGVVDPTADATFKLPALSAGTYYIPALAGTATDASSAVTAAEFALLDGGSSVATVTVADGDGVMFNDGGTMKHVTVESLAAYFDDEITAMPNLVSVGTIGTGVWQGTAIATGYIADDAITGAKIALFDDSLAATTTHFLIADGTDYSSFALSGDVTCTNGGVVTIANDAVESGMLNDNCISGLTELAAGGVAAVDELMVSDGGTLKRIGVDSFKAYVNAQDVQDDLDNSGTLAAGFNNWGAVLGGAESCTLPASPTVGDIVYVKAPSNCSSTNTITINKAGSQTIDGQTSIVLESPYAAVSLCYVENNVWSIF